MKKIIAVLIGILIIVTVFASCGAKNAMTDEMLSEKATYSEAEDAKNGFFVPAEEPKGEKSVQEGSKADAAAMSEKLIKTVVMNIETKEYLDCIASLKSNAAANGGYIESSETESNGYESYISNRYARMVFRIPADKLDSFIAGSQEKGKITSQTENVENVTMEYVDVESRIKAFTTERDTLLGILKKAENIADIIAVQERLSQVNYEIESYTARLRVLENRVGYSTVTITVREVQRVAEAETSLGTEIKNRFLATWDSLVDFLRSFVIGFVGSLPVLIPLAIVIFIVIMIIAKKIGKRRAKKKAALSDNNQK